MVKVRAVAAKVGEVLRRIARGIMSGAPDAAPAPALASAPAAREMPKLPVRPWTAADREGIEAELMRITRGVLDSNDADGYAHYFDAYAGMFPQVLKTPEDLALAAKVYDISHNLVWRKTQELGGLTSFNTHFVEPFSDYIAAHFPKSEMPSSPRATPRTAFLTGVAELEGGNALGRMTLSLVLGHMETRPPEDWPVVYFFNPVKSDLKEFLENTGIKARFLRRKSLAGTVEAIRRQCREDGIDALITDTNSSLVTVLFETRAAPLQVFHEMGFAAWRIRELDHLFLGVTREGTGLVADGVPVVRTPRNTAAVFQQRQRDDGEVAEFRARIARAAGTAAPVTVFGFYGRLVKIGPEFARCLAQLMARTEDAILYIGGTGPRERIDVLLRNEDFGDRVVFDHGFVDGHVVSQGIDVFLDSFPFPGGLSCIEAQARGVPVVWMKAGASGSFAITEDQRDPVLAATGIDDYCARALALQDKAAHQTRSTEAKAVAARFADVAAQARIVDGLLMDRWNSIRGC